MQPEYTFEKYKKEIFMKNPQLKELYNQEMLNFVTL